MVRHLVQGFMGLLAVEVIEAPKANRLAADPRLRTGRKDVAGGVMPRYAVPNQDRSVTPWLY